jgi:hypothetical protein
MSDNQQAVASNGHLSIVAHVGSSHTSLGLVLIQKQPFRHLVGLPERVINSLQVI